MDADDARRPSWDIPGLWRILEHRLTSWDLELLPTPAAVGAGAVEVSLGT